MESLQRNFEELKHRLKAGRGLSHSGDDPVWYLIFPPEQMLTVKGRMKAWAAQLDLDGWKIDTFSMAEAVQDILQTHDMRDLWLASEAEEPHAFAEINQTLSEALLADDSLQKRLELRLSQLAGKPKTVLFVTDLEALHPYLRVGVLEQRLQGKFTVPTVILYPGLRAGKTSLRFLGIYPEDGNYRSTHIGG